MNKGWCISLFIYWTNTFENKISWVSSQNGLWSKGISFCEWNNNQLNTASYVLDINKWLRIDSTDFLAKEIQLTEEFIHLQNITDELKWSCRRHQSCLKDNILQVLISVEAVFICDLRAYYCQIRIAYSLDMKVIRVNFIISKLGGLRCLLHYHCDHHTSWAI